MTETATETGTAKTAVTSIEVLDTVPVRFKSPEAREALAVGQYDGYRDAVQDIMQWAAVIAFAIIVYKLTVERE